MDGSGSFANLEKNTYAFTILPLCGNIIAEGAILSSSGTFTMQENAGRCVVGDAIAVMMSIILVMVISGTAGYRIARDNNRNPFLGLAIGAAIPFVGIGILLLAGRKIRR